MATNLAIDDELLVDAVEIGGLSTKRETVNLALREFVDRRKRRIAMESFGQFDFDDAYDYKKARQKP